MKLYDVYKISLESFDFELRYFVSEISPNKIVLKNLDGYTITSLTEDLRIPNLEFVCSCSTESEAFSKLVTSGQDLLKVL